VTTKYAAEHATALEMIEEAGSPLTFYAAGEGTYAEATDSWTAPDTVTSVEGHAVGVKGDMVRYRELGLTQQGLATLLFAPSTAGERPEPGYTATWNGALHTVKNVEPFAPDGTVLFSRVIVSR